MVKHPGINHNHTQKIIAYLACTVEFKLKHVVFFIALDADEHTEIPSDTVSWLANIACEYYHISTPFDSSVVISQLYDKKNE